MKRAGLLLIVAVIAFSWGFLAHRNRIFPYGAISGLLRSAAGHPQGKWNRIRPELSSAERAKLDALPYLQGYRPAPGASGVTLHDRERAFTGWSLYVSGHAPEATLIDMDGRILHRWAYPFRRVWPEDDDPATGTQYWRRGHVFPNGDLLAIFEGKGLIKLDAESNLLWSYGGGCHHDFALTESGDIWVLTRRPRRLEDPDLPAEILDDAVTLLDGNGRELQRISILDAFQRSRFAPVLRRLTRRGDVFHTNTLELLDGRLASRSAAFRAGNLLLSILYLDTIAVLDPERQEIAWTLTGMWEKQHQPTVLDDGRMLLFDNRGNAGKSRVLEFDPFTQEIAWQYAGSDASPLESTWNGSSQRLANGNTLITESDYGRALEVDPGGEIVWEFLNPNRAGQDEQLIATLFELVRLEPEFTPSGDWLAPAGPADSGSPSGSAAGAARPPAAFPKPPNSRPAG